MLSMRSLNVAKNSTVGLIGQILGIALSFVSRTIFIRVLGLEYLGVNGLFYNILVLLSFAELGIGNAIIYSMYKPLATSDREKIKSLMTLYAKAYKIIGAFVLIAGFLVIPFMKFIINEEPQIKENIIIVYSLILLNTSISYFFVYKKSIIIADQKNYVVLFYKQLFKMGQTIVQIFILLVTREYLLFLIIQIAATLLENLYMSRKADRMYPYLNECKVERLDNYEQKKIFSNVKAMFMYQIGHVVLSGTDNIIISAFIGIVAVGLNSNYFLIISAVSSILGQIMNGFTASVGNLNAVGSDKEKEKAFVKIFFLSSWLNGFCSVGLLIFINELIRLWIGESFLFPFAVVIAIVLQFYVNSMQSATSTYRVTMGLFVEGRWAPLAAAVLNIVLSVILGIKFGIAGIFFATSISQFLTIGLVDPILIFRRGFKTNPVPHFIKYFAMSGLFAALYFLLKYVVSLVVITGMGGFIVKVLLVSVLFNLLMIVIFWRYRPFIEIRKTASVILTTTLRKEKK